MSGASVLRTFGNKLYEHAFLIYRPLYAGYKACVDRAERQLLRQILFPGAVAVDGGANIGIYSRFLARAVGPTGAVHCFEPAPQNFKRLRAATRRFSNVHISQTAVGACSGHSQLYLSATLNVDHRTYCTAKSARRALGIEMVALDDYFKPGERVDLLKLDIQGYELHALQGAKRIMDENRKIKVLLEFWPYGLEQAGSNWAELIEMLTGRAMNLMFVHTHGLKPFNARDIRTDADWYVNLFASRTGGERESDRNEEVSLFSDHRR